MGEVLQGAFNERQKNEILRDKGYKYINTIIDSEILSFLEKNNDPIHESYNLYTIVNDTWMNMNTDLIDIISGFEGENNNYIYSVFKQEMEKYRSTIQNILNETKKRS